MFKWLERLFNRPTVDAEKKIFSPDGRVRLFLTLRAGHLSYTVSKDGR